MTLTLDANTTSIGVGSTNSHSFAHTCGTLYKGGLFLVVCLGSGSSFTGNVTATYNSVAMTKIGEVLNAAANYSLVAVFYLLKPSAGANTVAISWTGNAIAACVARSYSGVHPGVPIYPGSYTSLTGAGTTPSLNVTSQPGDIVMDGLSIFSTSGQAAGAGQTEILNTTVISTMRGCASVEAGAASVTMSWASAAIHAYAAFSIHPASSGGRAAISPSMIF